MRLFPLLSCSSCPNLQVLAWALACALLAPMAAAQSLWDGFSLPGGQDITALSVQSDGGIVVAGLFRVAENPDLNKQGRLIRLHVGGETDPSFQVWHASSDDEVVRSVVAREDGMLFAAGDFFYWNGMYAEACVRLYPDGRRDMSFSSPSGTYDVRALKVLPDWGLLVGGSDALLHLHPDGGVKASWAAPQGNSSWFSWSTVDALPDGSIVTAGNFSQFAGQPRNRFARILPNGTLRADNPFPGDSAPSVVAVQQDGKVLVGSYLRMPNLARLNADGSVDTAFVPEVVGPMMCITVQPDGKILIGGGFETVGGESQAYLARLHADGSLDTSFRPMADEWVSDIKLQPDGRILASGLYEFEETTERRTNIGRFYPDGRLEADLSPFEFQHIHAGALQPDGRLVFGQLRRAGAPPTDPAATLRRIHRDGTPDESLEIPTNATIRCVGVEANGAVVFGGDFTSANGTSRQCLARVTPEGIFDMTFAPNLNAPARALALRANDRWLVAGDFTQVNSTPCLRLACLLADGSVDTSFNANVDASVEAVSLLANGRCYVAGAFAQVSGTPRPWLARLEEGGGLDAAFAPALDGAAHAVCALDDGGCLVGGDFTTVNGSARTGLARLRADGTLDTTFAPTIALRCRSILQRADGVVQVAGESPTPYTWWEPRLLLLRPDGSILKDIMENVPTEGVNAWGRGTLHALVPEVDGKLYAGGGFAYYADQSADYPLQRNNLARCSAPPHTHQRLGLSRSGKVLTWTRLGGLARLEQVTFEAAGADGVWFPLGPGVRIGTTHDWAVSDLSLAPGQWQFRARGRVAGGSGSWHELATYLTVRSGTSAFDDWMESRHGPRAGDVAAAAPWAKFSSGIPHLLAYAMGAIPGQTSPPPPQQFPSATKTSNGSPAFRFPRWTPQADVALTVQTTLNLTGAWVDIARSIGGGAFSALMPEVAVEESNVEGTPTVTVTTPGLPAQPQRFYRVAVTLLNP